MNFSITSQITSKKIPLSFKNFSKSEIQNLFKNPTFNDHFAIAGPSEIQSILICRTLKTKNILVGTIQTLTDKDYHKKDLAEHIYAAVYRKKIIIKKSTSNRWIIVMFLIFTIIVLTILVIALKKNINGFGATQEPTIELLEVLNSYSPVKVAIVIQDSTEIRPSGGYIQAIYILSYKEGRPPDLKLLDLDKAKAIGQAEPPEDFASLFPKSTWTINDSNWRPYFKDAGLDIKTFIQKNFLESPDIVLALNADTISKILTITHPDGVQIPGFNVTSKNLITTHLEYAKKGGSTASLYVPLLESVYARLFNLTHGEKVRLHKLLQTELNQNQILVYPLLNQAQPVGCRHSLDCVSDYIYPLDTNIGLNKPDRQIERSHVVNVVIDETKINVEYILKYVYQPAPMSWPFGTAQTYLRLYLPASVEIDPVSLVEYRLQKKSGMQELSTKINLDPGNEAIIKIKYHHKLTNLPSSYQFDLPRHPGKSDEKLTFNVKYPQAWHITAYSRPTIANPGELEYNTRVTASTELGFNFTK